MNQTELPECEKISKKEPSKDVQMTQKQADRLVEHLKNIFMYVRVLRPDEIGDFIIDEENGKLCECYTVWNKAMPCLNCISEKALREKSQKSKLECIASNVYQVIARYVEIEGEPCVIEMINRLDDETPVSYTHLDVYKRQQLRCGDSACRRRHEAAAVFPDCIGCDQRWSEYVPRDRVQSRRGRLSLIHILSKTKISIFRRKKQTATVLLRWTKSKGTPQKVNSCITTASARHLNCNRKIR